MKQIFMLSLITVMMTACCPRKGATGAAGPQGAPGPQGVAGTDGTNGTNCSVSSLDVGSEVAPNGGSLIVCPDGSSSVVLNGTKGDKGDTGVDGQDGTNGTNGTNGVNGTNGTVITPVQFCSHFTQSYPSVFAESGLCINNVMYGVYSANGGFLAKLPLGTYSSNGINSSCTFQIKANCEVQ